ncbi:MAG: phosphohistidine phosphatase SixA [Candidatus Xenobia bacterium]
MRQLYLLRHALAVERESGTEDCDRPLSRPGKKRMKEIARAIARLDLKLDLVLASPFQRARQTAGLLLDALDPTPPLTLTETLQPEAAVRQVIDLLEREHADHRRISLVGHEPHLSHLAAWLLTGRAGTWLELKKAGLVALSYATPGDATLHWLLTPSQLEAM